MLPRPWRRESLAAFDRVLMRTLGMSAAWMGLALLWHVAMNMTSLRWRGDLRGDLGRHLRRPAQLDRRWRCGRPAEAGVLDRLKPMLPALLAYLTVILTAVTVGGVLIETAGADWFGVVDAPAAVMTALLTLALFITPDEVGLHAFYRERIARAYVGASNLGEDQRAATTAARSSVAATIGSCTDLRRPAAAPGLLRGERPARGPAGDAASRRAQRRAVARSASPWATMPRAGGAGARSGAAIPLGDGDDGVGGRLQLEHGTRSRCELGPAVTFLMSALNLRLGLWMPHPAASMHAPRRWPGLLFTARCSD